MKDSSLSSIQLLILVILFKLPVSLMTLATLPLGTLVKKLFVIGLPMMLEQRLLNTCNSMKLLTCVGLKVMPKGLGF
ncbi:hypothetical protein D3C76_1835250 [compost metagenome]